MDVPPLGQHGRGSVPRGHDLSPRCAVECIVLLSHCWHGPSMPSTFLWLRKNMLLRPLKGEDARSADLRVQTGREKASIRSH